MWFDKLTTIGNAVRPDHELVEWSKGKRNELLRTGLSNHMLSASGYFIELVYSQYLSRPELKSIERKVRLPVTIL